MKSKVVISILIVLTVIVAGSAIAVFVNPIIATQILNQVNGVTEPETTTESTTQEKTEPTTLASIEKIELEQTEYTLEVNSSTTLTPQVLPEQTPNKRLYYSSSDENIASVSVTGEVVGLSMGKCTINVRSDANTNITAQYTIDVTDKRIEDINLLNEHLNSIKNTQTVKYDDNNSKTVNISQVAIDDYNKDNSYEMFIVYSIGSDINLVEIATISDDKIKTVKGFDSFIQVLEDGYNSYNQDIYIDNSGKCYIKSETVKISGTKHTREVDFYNVDLEKMKISLKSNYKDVYTYEIDSKTPSSSNFYIDDEAVKEEPYLTSLSDYFDGYIKYDSLVKRYIEIDDSKYEKALPVVDLGEHYNNRIEWSVKDEKVATVNSSGVITAKKVGETQVTAKLEGLDSSINVISVNISNASKNLTNYLSEEKDKKITGSDNEKLSLYGSKLLDIDNDTVLELLLYYKGENQAQIDVVDEVGSQLVRTTAVNVEEKSGYELSFEIFIDNSTSDIVIQNKQSKKSGNSEIIEFYFREYIDSKYKKYSKSYKVTKTSDKVDDYYIDSKSVNEEEFETQTNHFGYYVSWDIYN